jgi:hypothetical protein
VHRLSKLKLPKILGIPLLHEHFLKKWLFSWKTSCYNLKLLRNYKRCFNIYITWHTFGAFVTIYLILNFLLPWQRGDISKMPKITILRCFLPSKLIQSATTSLWDEIESVVISISGKWRTKHTHDLWLTVIQIESDKICHV